MEAHRRSLAKAATWRIIAVFITMIAVYLYSRDIKESIIVSLAANGVKTFLYYLHERAWNKIDFGREKPPEYQI